MKKIIGTILTILFLVSCKNLEKPVTENSLIPENKQIQSESKQTESIVQKILDLPKLQWIYHPELEERLPVKVLETELIRKGFELNKFQQEVRIISQSELEKERILDYVIFHKLEIKNNTADFKLSYNIEGASCNGKLLKEKSNWTILNYSVWEN